MFERDHNRSLGDAWLEYRLLSGRNRSAWRLKQSDARRLLSFEGIGMQKPHRLLPSTAYDSYESFQRDAGVNAVVKARSLAADAVLAEIQQSGLRGRGGAGFPTGTKWRTLWTHPCKT